MSVLSTTLAKTPLFLRVVSLYIITGLLLWGGSYASGEQQNDSSVTVSNAVSLVPTLGAATMPESISGEPVRITIQRLNMDLPILEGVYDKPSGTWTLGDGVAYYATMTALPNNERGSTFIYGHNNDSAFAPLAKITAGDIVSIRTSNDHTLRYTYRRDEYVTPDSTQVLFSTSDQPRLILLTCEGIWSNLRRVMYFDFEGVT